MGLLWSSTRYHRPNALPSDTWKNIHPVRRGWEWQMGWGLLAASDIDTRMWAWRDWVEGTSDLKRQRTQSQRFGWLLWSRSRTTDAQGLAESSFFPPLYSQDITRDSVSRSLLLNTILWGSETKGDRRFRLLWGLGAYAYRNVWENGTSSHFALLGDLLFDASDYRNSDTTTYKNCTEKGVRQWQTSERSMLCGLLYHHEAYTEERDGPKGKERKNCDEPRLASDQAYKYHIANSDTSLLFGLLYSRTFRDRLEWTYPRGGVRPEKPTKDARFQDTSSALTPLIYRAERFRDGSFGRRGLLGLAYDHTLNAAEKTESLGILGYLFRSNLYADGTRERNLFPFLTHATNEKQGTWSFGFLHRLFRVERTPTQTDLWLLWLRL